jgi:FixJ family two-component response regulator
MQEGAGSAPNSVFVLDDDPSVRKALHRLFRSYGFSVVTFCSAAEFLASGESPGCLVLDVRMPGMNGFDLQRKLVSIGVDLPAVFITGQDTENTRAQALSCGARAYFVKPFENDELLKSVREALDSVGKRTVGDSV